MKNKVILWSVVLLGVGAAYYFLVYKKKGQAPKTKQDYINNIVYNIGSDAKTLSTFDLGYLQAWSNAIDANANTFVYNGKTYDASYGTVII
jgi:hypothetical protein